VREYQEHDRLSDLQAAHRAKMEDMIRTMWATPARTPEGRRAKVLVLLGCILPVDWREVEADWGVKEARDLLIEFVGGEPAKQLRDQIRLARLVRTRGPQRHPLWSSLLSRNAGPSNDPANPHSKNPIGGGRSAAQYASGRSTFEGRSQITATGWPLHDSRKAAGAGSAGRPRNKSGRQGVRLADHPGPSQANSGTPRCRI
jgi:hypothetical protein